MRKFKGTSLLAIMFFIVSIFSPWVNVKAALDVPTVITYDATNVTGYSATLNAEITLNGGADITEYGFCWGVNSAAPENKVVLGYSGSKEPISLDITGLTPGTTYYYFAYAKNSVGKSQLNEISFTTLPDSAGQNKIPTVTTYNAINIGSTSATLKGEILSNGGAEIGAYGFYWGLNSSNPENNGILGFSNYKGPISVDITGLTPGTKYYYYAYAINSVGKSQVNIMSFTTQSNNEVIFSDINLEKVVRTAINKPTGKIYESDVNTITQLNADNVNVTNLSGIESLKNLYNLSIDGNPINDASSIKDLMPLSNLKNLNNLRLSNCKVNDLSALTNLTNLVNLSICNSKINDISAINQLTNLETAWFDTSNVYTVGTLNNLSKLLALHLPNNHIIDISKLSNMPCLKILYLSNNEISDISSLRNLKSLQEIDLKNNKISDITPLGDLTNLKLLYIDGNTVSNFRPLEPLYNQLQYKDFRLNSILLLKALSEQNVEIGQVLDFKALSYRLKYVQFYYKNANNSSIWGQIGSDIVTQINYSNSDDTSSEVKWNTSGMQPGRYYIKVQGTNTQNDPNPYYDFMYINLENPAPINDTINLSGAGFEATDNGPILFGQSIGISGTVLANSPISVIDVDIQGPDSMSIGGTFYRKDNIASGTTNFDLSQIGKIPTGVGTQIINKTGTYWLYLYGKTSSMSSGVLLQKKTIIVTSDDILPVVNIKSPTELQYIVQGSTVELSGSATDNVSVSGMGIYIDGNKAFISYSDSISYNWNTTGASIGYHTIKITAVDPSNHSSEKTVNVKVGYLDSQAPIISSTSPQNKDKEVAITNRTISITFNEDVKIGPNFGDIKVQCLGYPPVEISRMIDSSNSKTLILTRNDNWTEKVDYTVTIPAGAVKDLAGNAFATNYSFSFTTIPIKVPVTNITLNNKTLNMISGGKTYKLIAIVLPSNATNKAVNWSSSDTRVATVDSKGVVTSVGPGKCLITAVANDGTGIKTTCEVTVTNPIISLNKSSATLNVGGKEFLIATIESSLTDKTVTWESSNPSVIGVTNKGEIYAVSPGTAVITAYSSVKDAKDSCTVTVKESETNYLLKNVNLKLDTKKDVGVISWDNPIPDINPTYFEIVCQTLNNGDKTCYTERFNVPLPNPYDPLPVPLSPVFNMKLNLVFGYNYKYLVVAYDNNNTPVGISEAKDISYIYKEAMLNHGSNTYKKGYNFFPEMFSDSTNYNASLSELSAIESALAYNKKTTSTTTGIQESLSALGFTDFEQFGYNDNNMDYQIAYCIGHRDLFVDGKKFNLIAVMLRGTVGNEWYSNWDILNPNLPAISNDYETETMHYGFNTTAGYIRGILNNYLNNPNYHLSGGNNKIWITGHSRAGAVANILGYNLTVENSTVEKAAHEKDIFVYTFAAPKVTRATNPQKVYNIYNIVNLGDFAPAMPPFIAEGSLGAYKLYGRTKNMYSTVFMISPYPMIYKDRTGSSYNGLNKEDIDKLTTTMLEATKNEQGNLYGYYKNYTSMTDSVGYVNPLGPKETPYMYMHDHVSVFLAQLHLLDTAKKLPTFDNYPIAMKGVHDFFLTHGSSLGTSHHMDTYIMMLEYYNDYYEDEAWDFTY